MERGPLEIDPDEMRRLGYRVVDAMVERVTEVRDDPPLRTATRDELDDLLSEPPPEDPHDLEQVLTRLDEQVLPYVARWDHPRFLAYVPGSGTWPAALGDFIASAINVDASLWREAAGPSELELVVLDWFRRWVGYPPEAAGVLTSGGSAANMTALACAREALSGPMDERVVAYLSAQTHSSMARAARALGFRPEQVRVLPVDDRFRLRPDALAEMIAADRAKGLRPLFVAAAAGSTSTGAVDDIETLAEVCRAHDVWLHVDGAYGGFAVLSDRGRDLLGAMRFADSITLDPHKWLYQPFECGCLLVREGSRLREAFRISPAYLRDTQGSEREVNFSDRGLQLTRTARAFKVWISMQYFGLRAFREAIDRSLDLARLAQTHIEQSQQLELVTEAQLSVVCFRRRVPGVDDEERIEAVNADLVRRLAESGEGLISSTRLAGRYVLRLCVLNHTTTASDIEHVLRWLERASLDLAAARHTVPVTRDQDVRLGWVGSDALSVDTLARVSPFDSLDDDLLAELAATAYVRVVPAGSSVVERWETSREFFVVLDGTVDIVVDGAVRDHLGRGSFFGELAALDWGAGYGFPRLATVVATADTQLLVVPDGTLNHLVRASEPFAAAIEAAVGRRLPGL